MTTGFIGETYPDGYTPGIASGTELGQMRALAAVLVADRMARVAGIGGASPETSFHCYDAAGEVAASIALGDKITVTIDGDDYVFEDRPDPSARLFQGQINGKSVQIQHRRKAETVHLMMGAVILDVLVLPARTAAAYALMPVKDDSAGALQVVSPMPGLLSKLLVQAGDTVAAGDDVAVIEAMKMENLLKADAGGVVAEVHAAEGENLMVDQPILSFVSADNAANKDD